MCRYALHKPSLRSLTLAYTAAARHYTNRIASLCLAPAFPMSQGNNQGWKLGVDICTKKDNPLLYTIFVNLTGNQIDYYIYEYDVLSEKVKNLYADYLLKPKRDGGARKDIAFRWFNLNDFKEDDWERKNNWDVLGFNSKL